jgi:[acyl-carrier-protein] S-malonyltransferase
MGAKRVEKLSVGGAFHSPLMEPARQELEKAITETEFATPICPIYQNFTAEATTDPDQIRHNLIMQLTSPVKWTQTLQHMVADGVTDFVEIGPGKVLSGMVKKVDRKLTTLSIQTI